jgi:hypothetical protein
MPSDTQKQASELVDQYLELQEKHDQVESELQDLKKTLAAFSRKTNQKHLKSGNIILKVRQFEKTTFPKVDQKGREQVEDIMRKSKEWKHAITFDIVKLGLAYDKNKLSEDLKNRLAPYTDKEEVIRVTKSKLKYKKKKKHEEND